MTLTGTDSLSSFFPFSASLKSCAIDNTQGGHCILSMLRSKEVIWHRKRRFSRSNASLILLSIGNARKNSQCLKGLRCIFHLRFKVTLQTLGFGLFLPLLTHSIPKEFPFIFLVFNHSILFFPSTFLTVCVTLSNIKLLQDVEILKSQHIMNKQSFGGLIYSPADMAHVLFISWLV